MKKYQAKVLVTGLGGHDVEELLQEKMDALIASRAVSRNLEMDYNVLLDAAYDAGMLCAHKRMVVREMVERVINTPSVVRQIMPAREVTERPLLDLNKELVDPVKEAILANPYKEPECPFCSGAMNDDGTCVRNCDSPEDNS